MAGPISIHAQGDTVATLRRCRGPAIRRFFSNSLLTGTPRCIPAWNTGHPSGRASNQEARNANGNTIRLLRQCMARTMRLRCDNPTELPRDAARLLRKKDRSCFSVFTSKMIFTGPNYDALRRLMNKRLIVTLDSALRQGRIWIADRHPRKTSEVVVSLNRFHSVSIAI